MRIKYEDYLASGKGILHNNETTYNDLIKKRDIIGDMMDVDLTPYDVLIATPPCNYYSRANYRRETSRYSQETKHLLPSIINKFLKTGKPFIVENVINKTLMKDIITAFPYSYIEHGRHCYFTNIKGIDKVIATVPQKFDNVTYKSTISRQGGTNVNDVFDKVIEYLKGGNYEIQ